MSKAGPPPESPLTEPAPQLSPGDFRQISRLAYDYAGLDLSQGKTQLVATRLGKKLRQLHLRSYREYCRHVVEDETGEALIGMIDALTTNHTSFLREQAHFDFLSHVILPPLHARNTIAIWSAACSTGEEPYSIAFTALECLGREASHKLHILATDISTKALAAASQAVYPLDRLRGVSADWLSRYLLRGTGRQDGYCQVKRQVRDRIEFRRQNLMESFAHLGPFPVIFCRNVMIYFDEDTQNRIWDRFTEHLVPGGTLFIGHSERVPMDRHPFDLVGQTTYRKRTSRKP